MRTHLCLFILLGFSLRSYGQQDRIQRVYSLYNCIRDCRIQNPKTILAIAVLETGWMECHHCSYQFNNLFGFRGDGEYMRFSSIYECIEYFKRWEAKYYLPWKARHPQGNYYDFIRHMKFAPHADRYIQNVRSIERWLSDNLYLEDSEFPEPVEPVVNH
jgi:hypothetical protein